MGLQPGVTLGAIRAIGLHMNNVYNYVVVQVYSVH